MRIGLAAGLIAGAALMTAVSPASAETWCRNGSMCVFSSYQQCASTIGVMGGVCTRERAMARYAEPRPVSSRGSSRYASYSSTPLPLNVHPSRFDCNN